MRYIFFNAVIRDKEKNMEELAAEQSAQAGS